MIRTVGWDCVPQMEWMRRFFQRLHFLVQLTLLLLIPVLLVVLLSILDVLLE